MRLRIPPSLSRHCVPGLIYLRPVLEIKLLRSVPIYLPIVDDEDEADELIGDEDEEGGGGVRHL